MSDKGVKELLEGITEGEWDIVPCATGLGFHRFKTNGTVRKQATQDANNKLIAAAPTIARDYLALINSVKGLVDEWKDEGGISNHFSDELSALLEKQNDL